MTPDFRRRPSGPSTQALAGQEQFAFTLVQGRLGRLNLMKLRCAPRQPVPRSGRRTAAPTRNPYLALTHNHNCNRNRNLAPNLSPSPSASDRRRSESAGDTRSCTVTGCVTRSSGRIAQFLINLRHSLLLMTLVTLTLLAAHIAPGPPVHSPGLAPDCSRRERATSVDSGP
jgi:hypothetical protein